MSAPSPTDAGASPALPAARRREGAGGEALWACLLVLPALATIALFFVYPLTLSVVGAFRNPASLAAGPAAGPAAGADAGPGPWGLANFATAFTLYGYDILYTVGLVALASLLVGLLAIAIGGYLTLGSSPAAVAVLRWLYRWPLFIPFIVAAQMMRSFLAKNGLMNAAFVGLGLYGPLQAPSLLDWRGVLVTLVWKQTPFVALMVAGAMASLDRSTIEAARNLGAGRLRILFGIIVPQVRPTLLVGLVLSVVAMMSVLSVPMMINAGSPTMMTVDMAFRINAHGDYGVADALGLIAYLVTGAVAWLQLRRGLGRSAPR